MHWLSHNRFILLALLLLPGCAAARQWSNKLAGPDERKVKRESALAEFEQRRNEVQFKAAIARLEQGEIEDARRMLNDILARNRDHRDSSLLLADLCIEEDDFAGAEEVLLAALRQNTEAADLHHALGSVLELADRLPEAKAHFARANELARDNPAYQESLAGLEQVTAAELLVASAPAPAKRKIAMASFSDAK